MADNDLIPFVRNAVADTVEFADDMGYEELLDECVSMGLTRAQSVELLSEFGMSVLGE